MKEFLVYRLCPFCKSDYYDAIVSLKQSDFIPANLAYRSDFLFSLKLEPDFQYPIVRCKECSFVYSLYHLDDIRERALYELIISKDISFSKVNSWGRKRGDLLRLLSLVELLSLDNERVEGLKILDYGCGWGTFLEVAASLHFECFGFDTTSWKVNYVQNNGLKIVTSHNEIKEHGPYDLFVCTSVLEHLHDPLEVMYFLSSQVKPNGYALVTGMVPSAHNIQGWRLIRKKLKKFKSIPKEINPWEHLNYFSHETLVKLMEAAHFKPVNPIGFWITKEHVLKSLLKSVMESFLPKSIYGIRTAGIWQKTSCL